MKQRITFFRDNDDPTFSPDRLFVSLKSMSVSDVKGAKEHRITFSLSELPTSLAQSLRRLHELRIRWTSPKSSVVVSPLFSSVPSGLHIFYAPLEEYASSLDVCPLLHDLFSPDLKCTTSNGTFSTPPILSSRFTSSASLQYFALLPSLDHFNAYIQRSVCVANDTACRTATHALRSASALDVDFDAISHTVTVTALWDKSPASLGWSETITSPSKARTEVGVLNQERAIEPEELSLAGWLTVIGEDTKPSTTHFSFPSRHHHSSLRFTTTLQSPTGLHPTLSISFPSSKAVAFEPPLKSCALHAYLTLPSTYFIDRYAFGDSLFLKSHNLGALHALSGATDLEAPEWAVATWGSAALFELRNPVRDGSDNSWNATIPLHLRYLSPSVGGYDIAALPWPVVFWACRAEEGSKMSVNPFDRTSLGYDGLFGDRTMFYHARQLLQSNQQAIVSAEVPVLDVKDAPSIHFLTVVAIVLGFMWVCWQLVRPMGKSPSSDEKAAKKHDKHQ